VRAPERPIVKQVNRVLFCSLLVSASMQAMACYTVYDRSNRVLYQGTDAPVDMRLQIHDALAARFPGGHMVFDTATECPAVIASAPPPVKRSGTTLLTDQETAQAMRLPYTQLAGGIALVQSGNARIEPGVTVVPAEGTALASARRTGRDTVITEYRDPRGAIVELADRDPAAATRSMGAGPAPRR
jgi:hypothetical protein